MNTSHQSELRALQLTLGVYLAVFAMKLTVYFMTSVMALLAEALHTLSDIFVSAFLLMAAIWSRKEADAGHMFGHGRAQNVAALVAATLFISFTSFKLYEEAIPRLFQPHEAAHQNLPLALGVLVVSMVIAAAPLISLFMEKKRGAAAKAQLTELVNDELGLVAAFVGTLFILWGQPLADPIAAIVVATIIAVNAVGLFRENLSFLVGRSPGPEFMEKVTALGRSVPGVLDVHNIRAEYIGPDTMHAEIHIRVQRGLLIEEADRIAGEVRERVYQATDCRYCTIHVDATKAEKVQPGSPEFQAPAPQELRGTQREAR